MKKDLSLAKNAILNGIRQVFTIIFPLITFPYASRVLGAEFYGKINFSSSVITYISLIAGLGIYSYAVRECSKRVNKDDFNDTLNEILTLNICSTLIAYAVLIILIIIWPKLSSYLTILVIQAALIIFQTIGMEWLNSVFEDYLYLTVRYVACQLISIILMFATVKTDKDYLWYVFSCLLGNMLSNITNFFYAKKRYNLKLKIVSFRRFKKHLKPVLILFGSVIALEVYVNSDITLIGYFLDDASVGYYSVSVKIYMLIKSLFNAFLLVAMPRFSKEFAYEIEENAEKKLSEILSLLLLIILPAAAGLIQLSKNIILLIAGEGYVLSDFPLKVLSVALIFATVACFFVNLIMIPKSMDKSVTKATMLSAVINIVLNIVLIPKYGIIAAAFTTLLSECIMALCGVIYTKRAVKLNIKGALLTGVIGSVIVFAVTKLVFSLISNNVVQIILSVIFSVLIYGLLLLILLCKKGVLKHRNKI